MPGCIFHVSGENFDVDAFLARSPFGPYRVAHRGEPKGRKSKRWPYSGFSVEVSKAYGDLAKQCEDVAAFLGEYHAEVSRLSAFPGVTDLRLDFGYERRDVAVQTDYLPPELLVLVGSLGIGIVLTLYPNERQMEEILCEDDVA